MITSQAMLPDTPPTAEGDLAQTPYAHLAVYALDRRLTGELFLQVSEEVTHVVRFERGVPVKIRMGDGFARLGELLVEDGLVSAEAVEGAAMTGGLLGDVLVLAGRVESEALNVVLERQFRLRSASFFELPPETSYKYFEGSEVLKDWGGENACCDPLALLWSGIRLFGECSAFFEATLDRLQGVALKLHPQATVARFELEEDAQLVAEVLGLEPTTLAELLDIEGVPPDTVNKLVYALAITRQLDLGRGTFPVGSEQKASSLAKVQLRSQVHRVGAAVDAPVAEGERSIRTLSARRKGIIPRDDDSIPPPEAAPSDVAPPTVPSAEASSPEAEPTSEPKQDEAPAKEPPSAGEGAKAPEAGPDADTPAEESSRRLVADTIRALPFEALKQLVREKIQEKEATMAAEVCEIALARLDERDAGPDAKDSSVDRAELVALHAWARSLEAHPDLKGLAMELDERIRERDDLVLPRLVRGVLRKRLGNEAGAASDFRRVLELEPGHEGAKKELASFDVPSVKRGETGFLKRLFRR